MYLTYSEYQAMGGALAEPIFERLELQAAGIVDLHTFNRVARDVASVESIDSLAYAKQLKSLTYALTELENTANQDVSSVSNNGISVAYKNASEHSQAVKSLLAMLTGFTDLGGTRLLWRGIR